MGGGVAGRRGRGWRRAAGGRQAALGPRRGAALRCPFKPLLRHCHARQMPRGRQGAEAGAALGGSNNGGPPRCAEACWWERVSPDEKSKWGAAGLRTQRSGPDHTASGLPADKVE